MKLTAFLSAGLPLLAFGITAGTNATVKSRASVFNNLAAEELKLVKSGNGVLKQASDVKEDVLRALGKSNPGTAAKVGKLMDTLRRQETTIMHSEAEEAKRDKLEAHNGPQKVAFSQQAAKDTVQNTLESSRVRLARVAAQRAVREVHSVAQNLHIVKEINQADAALEHELGKKAPQVEAQVEKLLNMASSAESHLVHEEFDRAGTLIAKAEQSGVPFDQLKRAGLQHEAIVPVIKPTQEKLKQQKPAMSQAQSSVHVSSKHEATAQQMADLADKELKHARHSLEELRATEKVDRMAVKELARRNPHKAKKVNHLLSLARRQEKQDIQREFQHARRDWKKAIEAEKKHPRQEEPKPELQAEKPASLNPNVVNMANVADKEVRNANKGLKLFKELKSLDGAIEDALEHPNTRNVKRVHRILAAAQQEQGAVVQEEFKEANEDWRAAVKAESEHLH